MTATIPVELAGHLSQSVRKGRRRYRKRLAKCQKKFSESAVHELRVETRRILALLDLLDAVRFDSDLKKLRRTFKERLDCFDELRDTQVQLGLLKPLWKDFPEAHPFHVLLKRCERQLVAALSRKIGRMKCNRLNRRLKELEKHVAKCAAPSTAAKSHSIAMSALRRSFRDVMKLRRRIRGNDTETIHRMRVGFKYFRYMAELLRRFLPGFDKDQLERMRRFQSAAGDIQDLDVLLLSLARNVRNRKMNPTVIRNLRDEIARRRRETIAAFMERIDDLNRFDPVVLNSRVATAA